MGGWVQIVSTASGRGWPHRAPDHTTRRRMVDPVAETAEVAEARLVQPYGPPALDTDLRSGYVSLDAIVVHSVCSVNTET